MFIYASISTFKHKWGMLKVYLCSLLFLIMIQADPYMLAIIVFHQMQPIKCSLCEAPSILYGTTFHPSFWLALFYFLALSTLKLFSYCPIPSTKW